MYAYTLYLVSHQLKLIACVTCEKKTDIKKQASIK